MAQFNFTYDPNVSLEQRIGFQMAAAIWSTFLLDDVDINLHIGANEGLDNNQAVGGAIPIFHEQHYGVYQEYVEQDITSVEDTEASASLQDGNTVDVLINGEVIDGNTTILLTSAQAKALGMVSPLVLGDDDDDDDDDDNDDNDNDNDDNDGNDNNDGENSYNNNYNNSDDNDDDNDSDDYERRTWDRDLVDPDALDGYIVVNNSYDWSYDFTRESEVPPNSLDFLTMALHEIGHTLGFVSGLDGLLETFQLHSGETQAEGFTALDLFRRSIDSQAIENPDGDVADLTLGANAHFSLDGETALADFSTGQDTEAGGDGYQASHWQRFQQAVGIMDPTLGYQERTDISHLDLQAFDALGWDINYAALEQGLDFQGLYAQASQAIAIDFGIGVEAVENALDSGQDWYTLARGAWWESLKDQMIELSHGGWWQEFEAQLLDLSPGGWWQSLDQQMLELGPGSWWQIFEDQVLALGHGGWWQQFEAQMLDLSPGGWWQQFEPQMIEMSFGGLWQVFEQQMLLLGHGGWWQEFEAQLLELGHGSWWQAFGEQLLELGPGGWWQIFEETVLELGHGVWWQEFEAQMLDLAPGGWWQAFELGPGSWWQQIEQHLDTIETYEELVSIANSNGASTEVFGGSRDDILAGGQGRDWISGGAGDDLIDGKDGDEIILGDRGNDILYGWTGQDIIYGGDGDDLLSGENDDDQLYGEAGADILAGGRGDDFLDGGEGRDVLKGDIGQDVLLGGAEDDRLSGGSGADLLIGGIGEDVVDGGDDNDILYGDDYFVPIAPTTNTDETASNRPLATNPTTTLTQDFWLRLEAEDFNLRNYHRKGLSDASGGKVITTRGEGEAWTIFSGPSGAYDLVVGYNDGAYGEADITLSIDKEGDDDDIEYDWKLDGDAGTGVYTISGVNLSAGDRIVLEGEADGGDFARLDYVDILTSGAAASVDATGAPPEEAYTFVGGANGEGQTIVEAESMELGGGYTLLADPQASEGAVIAATGNTPGTAAFTYTGPSGVYNLYANYFDSSAGNAQAEVFLNGVSLNSWEFNQNDDAAHEQTLGLGVALNPGDVIQIQGEVGVSSTFNPDEGLVAHWTFDETSGTTAHDATGTHNATLQNSLSDLSQYLSLFTLDLTSTDNSQWDSSPLGGALKLDGVNDYVTVANHTEINLGTHAQKTISLWFKVDDATIADRKQVIYEQGGTARGLNLYIHDGNLYAGGWNNVSAESNWTGTFLQTDQIVSGQWHHVALILDGNGQLQAGALKAYLDGELFGAGEGSQLWQHAGGVGLGAVNADTYFHDGPVSGSGGHTLSGSLDDVRIYNRALNGIQIQEEVALATSAANLVTNGSFEDNSVAANSWGLVNSLSGWAPTVQSVIEVQELSNLFGSADEGEAWLELDSIGNGGVAQTLSTTAQTDYQLSFAYSPRPGVASASNGVAVYWDGQLLDTISRAGGSQNDWQTYTYDVTASNSNTALEFRAIGGSDGVGAFLDDVKVQPILANDHVEVQPILAGDQAIIDYLVLEQAPNTIDSEPSSPEVSASPQNQLSLFKGVHVDSSTGVFNFDGYNDYGELTGAETGGAMTFAAWVNYDSFNRWSRIFDFGDGAANNNILLANKQGTNTLKLHTFDGSQTVGVLEIEDFWQTDAWIHVTATIDDSGTMRVYKNGALAGESVTAVVPTAKVRAHNYIGRSHWSQDDYFDGQLKDVELLNEALDAVAVQALYGGEISENTVNVDATNNQPLEAVTLQLEVEDMNRSGSGQQVSQSFASGGQYIRTGTTTNTITTYENVYVSGGGDDDDDDDSGYWTTRPVYTTETTATGVQFNATSLFSGETGAYDITVGYYDENDGAAEIIVKVGNQEIDRWFANKNLGSGSPTASTFTTRTVAQGLQISNLDLVEIIAIGDDGDQANLDYIEFVKAAEQPTQAPSVDLPTPSSASLLGNNDVLRGGAGNDTAYGGEGDDIVYGDEGDDTLYGDFAALTDHSLQNGVQVDAATGALDFDGNDDYGELTGVETGGAMTFSTWVNYDSFNHWSRIFDFGDGAAQNNILLANQGTTNNLVFEVHADGASHRLSIANFWQANTWMHITATLEESGRMRVYRDGILVGETISSVIPSAKTRAHNYIGKSHWTQDGAFDGQLNDVALLNEALSEDAVQSLYREALLSFGGEIYNGGRYLLTDSTMTWEDAQTYAESLGGNLVTINNANEEAWLQSTFGTTEGFWIGINDRLVEGQFEWASGEAVTYTNWAPGEPNNWSGNQDYGLINYGGANQWDDTSHTAQLRGIIEIKLTPEPEGGNDSLIGGNGDDTLYGGDGDDILNGTDSVAVGLLEIDSLTGGAGADQFILGDANTAFYSTGGDQDYAVIQDFTAGLDTVQLHGSASNYHQSSQAGDLFLYHGPNQDLVAQFESLTSLNFNSHVTFV